MKATYMISKRGHEAAASLPNGHSLVRYFEERHPVGGFLTALLANDLVGAFNRADNSNSKALGDYASWLYNHAPACTAGGEYFDAWGSYEAVRNWAPGSG